MSASASPRRRPASASPSPRPRSASPRAHSPEQEDVPSRIESVRHVQELIKSLQLASLDNDNLSEEAVHALRHPDQRDPIPSLTTDSRLAYDMYLATCREADHVYTDVAAGIARASAQAAIDRASTSNDDSSGDDSSELPDPIFEPLPSLYNMRKQIETLTCVSAVEDDMCPKGCLAYVGPYAELDACPSCSEPRYFPSGGGRSRKRIPRQRMTTVPLGPQIAALRRSSEGSKRLQYRMKKTAEVLERRDNVRTPEDRKNLVYDDIFSGDDFVELHRRLSLTESDITVGFAIDGAQLYDSKKSDTWIGIWIIYDLDPVHRYKRKHVLPALVVPGPEKPKDMDSFTYRAFHHLSALQRENGGLGVRMQDALLGEILCRIILLLLMADAVGLVELDGRVGHHGGKGCRLGCPMKSRHKANSGHYYPAHLLPLNFTVQGCSHPDILPRDVKNPDPSIYDINLASILASTSQRDYERRRLEAGLVKPSMSSGLERRFMFRLSLQFSLDLMHLFMLNGGDLWIPLWRATIPHGDDDPPPAWPWHLPHEDWITHGAAVGDTTRYFPSSFHRPPRNPAEKVNTNYKATEWYLYLYGLGPSFFRVFLPKVYWQNFCRLVYGVRIMVQRRLTYSQISDAQTSLILFVEEYEHLYYQRRVDRMHFCRPWLHTLLHVASEALRVGPGCYITQFTNERVIGYLGQSIRQPSNPHRNLAKIAEREAQINALKITYPELEIKKPVNRASQNVGHGYIFLPPRMKTKQRIVGDVGVFLETEYGPEGSEVRCWGKVLLPNGQKLRSLFAESRSTREDQRVGRIAKVYSIARLLLYGR